MEKSARCTKCRKPFEAVGEGTLQEVAQLVTCPYCDEPNEVMWPMDGSVASRGLREYLEGEERTSSLPTEAQRQALMSEAENQFWSAGGSEDGLVAPVDPSDVKAVWKLTQEVRAQHGPNECIGIGVDMFAQVCSPSADVTAVWYRVSILSLLAEQLKLFPPGVPDAVKDVVFKAISTIPMKRMVPGIEYEGLPLDLQEFVKQIERDVLPTGHPENIG